ncbi:MAG TPA: FliA/WhiG family RNA polymerase sigma factor [Gemmatimonadales bacterium]|nr:FliA/WhiG family RNA polymerase sigma factor [Gemmatimonadales bacterium]
MHALTQSLWERYRATGEVAARAQLLDQHLGLVQAIAREIAQRVPPEVELDDLVSAGTLGLVRALESFEPARGLEFSTYATPRIRGAILDELRAQDWVPRSVRRRAREIAAAVAALEHRLGRSPSPAEVARELGIALDEYWRWRRDVDRTTLVRFPRTPDGAAGDDLLADPISEAAAVSPDDAGFEREDETAALRALLAELPPTERSVLALYYYEEMNLRQIGEVLHLTESRISQIRSRALQRLRERLTTQRSTR